MPYEGYLDESVHGKVRNEQIGFVEPVHREAAGAILETWLAADVGQRLGSGKEADVYLCRDGRRPFGLKVYRQYRTAHRGGGPIRLESMGQRASREFELLCSAWQGASGFRSRVDASRSRFRCSIWELPSRQHPCSSLFGSTIPDHSWTPR